MVHELHPLVPVLQLLVAPVRHNGPVTVVVSPAAHTGVQPVHVPGVQVQVTVYGQHQACPAGGVLPLLQPASDSPQGVLCNVHELASGEHDVEQDA